MSYSLGNKGLLNRTNRTNRPLNFGSMMEDAIAQAKEDILAAGDVDGDDSVSKPKPPSYPPSYPSKPTPTTATVPASGGVMNFVMIGIAALIFLLPSKK